MTAEIPNIEVVEEEETTIQDRKGIANKIALIGAFDTLETTPQVYTNLTAAKTALGTDDTYNGCKILPLIFNSTGLLVVNITTETGGTREKTLTTAKLTEALAKIKHEDFDMLFIADTLEDSALVIMDTFFQERMKMKMPAEYVFACTRSTVNDYVTTASKTGKYVSGMVVQPGGLAGVNYSLLETAALYAKYISELPVRESMTNQVVPFLDSVTPEYTFENGDDGKTLVGAGVTIFKVKNRQDGTIVVVNSEQPNGLDLYINRVRNYVIKEMNVEFALGKRNRPLTHSEIEHIVDTIKYKCTNVDELDLLKDIKYTVNKSNSKCVEITITELLFEDIITKIRIKYKIKVE